MVQNSFTDAANSGLVRVQYGPTRTDPFSSRSLSLSLSPFPNVGSFSSQPACHASPVDWKVLVIEAETTISPSSSLHIREGEREGRFGNYRGRRSNGQEWGICTPWTSMEYSATVAERVPSLPSRYRSKP